VIGRTPLIAILAVAGLARFWAIDFCLPSPICRPDEEAVTGIVVQFFARDFNPNFFDWPTLFMYLVGAGTVVFFKIGLWLHWFRGEYHFLEIISNQPAPVFLIARLVSATAGTISVWLVFRIADRLFDRTTALMAAAFLALAFLHVRDSHFGVTDVTATCFALAALLFLIRFDRSQATGDLIASAIWAGLAASTKYGVALVAVPAIWVCLRPDLSIQRSWFVRLKQAAGYLVVMAIAFALTSPYCLIAFDRFVTALGGVSAHLARPHGVMVGRGWQVHLTSSLRYGLGLPLLVAGLVGLALLLWRRPRKGAIVALFPLTYYVTVGSAYTVFARYAVPLVPLLCLAAAFAVAECARIATRAAKRVALERAVAWILALLVIAPSVWSVLQFDRLLSRPDSRVVAATWVTTHVSPGASIGEIGSPWTHLLLQSAHRQDGPGYRQFLFKQGDEPDLLVVPTSRRLIDELPAGTTQVMERYRRVCEIEAFDLLASRIVYDWQDEFYLPLSGFRGVRTPGPNIAIYARPDFETANQLAAMPDCAGR
jgi:hypothetical protein